MDRHVQPVPADGTSVDARALPFDFYATVDVDSAGPTQHEHMPDGVAWLLPASSWARKGLPAPGLPNHCWLTAADSGGFVAMRRNDGRYPYTLDAYVGWLAAWQPAPPLWAAMMDYPCEPVLACDPVAVRDLQRRTSSAAHATWRQYRDVPWEWVPTVQGYQPDEYVSHARELAWLIDEMGCHYAASSSGSWEFRVGIGSLCSRTDVSEIADIVEAVAGVLDTARFHLWGVKLAAIGAGLPLERVVSVDSAAWNGRFGRDIAAINAEQRALGLTQRAYGYRVALPRYLARVADAVGRRAR